MSELTDRTIEYAVVNLLAWERAPVITAKACIEMATPIGLCGPMLAFLRDPLELALIGGLGGAVAEVLAENPIGAKMVRIGLEDRYSSVVGSQEYLRNYYGMDATAIAKRVRQALAGQPC